MSCSQALARGLSSREAYREAGFDTTNEASTDACASRLLSEAKVQQRIVALQQTAAMAAGASVEIVLATFMDVLAADDATAKPSDRIRAAELIGKHLGMFRDRFEHSGPNGGPIEAKPMSTLDLARSVAFLLAKAQDDLANGQSDV